MDGEEPALNAVVDASVVVYHLLDTRPFARKASGFFRRSGELYAPSVWEAEVANTLWMACRSGIIDTAQALTRIRWAGRLSICTVDIQRLWEGALLRAAETDHPVYDTLYVELARRLDVPLVTFDESLLTRFPSVARRP